MIRSCLLIGLMFGIVLSGCKPGVPSKVSKTKEQDSASSNQTNKNVNSETNDSGEGAPETEVSSSATRSELDAYLAKFNSNSGWTYGERTAGELAGKWVSEDGRDFLIFEPEGKTGEFVQSFNGGKAIGLYAISDEGKIVAFAKKSDIRLGSHYTLVDTKIVGPKGPNPSATWIREVAGK